MPHIQKPEGKDVSVFSFSPLKTAASGRFQVASGTFLPATCNLPPGTDDCAVAKNS
jgi:hypothetical protein